MLPSAFVIIGSVARIRQSAVLMLILPSSPTASSRPRLAWAGSVPGPLLTGFGSGLVHAAGLQ